MMFSKGIDKARIKADQVPKLLLNERIYAQVSAMLENPNEHRLPLGIILSQISLDQIPEGYRKQLKPHMSGLKLKLETSYAPWQLCPDAENRLNTAIDDEAVMALGDKDNPYLLLKFYGKLSALCFEDFATADGKVFLRGNWYSPTDDDTKKELRNDFDKRRGVVTLSEGDWALMRPYNAIAGDDLEKCLNKARQTALHIPEEYPDKEILKEDVYRTRNGYRYAYEEDEH